jgi:hypothetical protein
MLRRTVSWALAALVIASSRGMAAAQAPEPELMDDGTAPVSSQTLRRIETRLLTDASGRKFERITWSDEFGRRRVTVEPAGQRGERGTPVEEDGVGGVASDGVGAETFPNGTDAVATIPATGGKWTSIGPDGGVVNDVNVSPVNAALVLAAVGYNQVSSEPGHSIYRSTDGGATWSPSLTLDPQINYERGAYEIAFAPDGVAYAATGQGVYRSRDGGLSWDRLYATVSLNEAVLAVTVDPADSRHVWIGLKRYQNIAPRVLRTTDEGATWTPMDVPALPILECRTIAFDPARAGVVFLGFGHYTGGQVWFSSDDGAHWVQRSSQLPGTAVNKLVVSGQTIIAALGEWISGATNGGIYFSSNDGVGWDVSRGWLPGLSTVAEDVAVDPANPCVIWIANAGGVQRSLDCGQTWALQFRVWSDAHSVRVFPGGVVFAGDEVDGVLKKVGATPLAATSRGIRELNVTQVASNPMDPNEMATSVMALNNGGVYTSLDAGATWKREYALDGRMTAVRFAPNGLLHAISDGPSDIAGEGLYRRSTSGAWGYLGPNRGRNYETQLTALCFDPEHPGVVIVGGSDYLSQPAATGIWRSDNGGLAWQQVLTGTFGTVTDLAVAGAGASRGVLASIHYWVGPVPGVLLRSPDLGVSWAEVSSPASFQTISPQSFAVSRQNPDRVYMTGYFSSPGMLRSDDAGRTWTRTGYQGYLYHISVHPDDDRALYGITNDAGKYPVVRSLDEGATFTPFNQGLIPSYGGSLAMVDGECPRLLLGGAYSVNVRVADVGRPRLDVRADPNELWPPNHEMVEVHATVSAHDDCDPNAHWKLVSITSDGVDVAADVDGAAFGTADDTFRLRAARAGSSDGRQYAITYEAEDESGNTERRTVFIVAPHDQSGRDRGALVTGGGEVPGAGAVPSAPRLVATSRDRVELRFGLRRADRVRVEVFDLLGARVRVLVDEQRAAGEQALVWDGRDADGRAVSSGVYLVRVMGGVEWSGKAVLVK